MSALAAATLSSSALAQTSSTGTAVAVSTEAPASVVPLPGLSTGTWTPLASTAAPVALSTETAAAPDEGGVIPRPWVLGEIKADGLKNLKMSTIRGQIKARKGDLYDRPDLDRDIQALLGMGDFEQVGAELSLLEKKVPESLRKTAGQDRLVRLTFTVTEKPRVKKIHFEGNKGVSRGVLSDQLSVKTSDPLDRFKVDEDRRKLVEKYHEKGFLDASVDYEIKIDTKTLKSEITFKVAEGIKSRIELVELRGVTAFKPNKLLGLMKNRRKKVYFEKDLAEDVKKVEAHYKNNGFLDVRLSTPLVTLSEDKTRIYVALGVEEGRSYRFGETTFSGYLVLTSSELYKTIEYRAGKLFSQEKYEDTIRSVQELYADVGRLRARIRPSRTLNPQTDRMDVHFEITEGPLSYVGHVDVEGNKATKTKVISREIVIKPGERYSHRRVKKSREKIMNLGFMDDVDVDLQQNQEDPDKVDLTFDVVEGKPGVLTAGAAYSSIDGLIGTLSLQHLNLFGRAQRMSVQWSFGRRVQDYSVSWTTPWVGERPMSLGVDGYNTRRVNPFGSSLSAYVERRTGAAIRLGPRFQEDRYHLNLTYSLTRIQIQNIQNEFVGTLTEGTSIQSMVGAELARDTRDSIWDPASGQRHGAGVALSGGPLQGSIHFLSPTVSNQAHWTAFTYEEWPFVLSGFHRAGYITQFSETKQVPVQNRFFVGGQDSLRGYSPSGEAGYPQGGKLYSVANLEFGFPLARERKKTIVKLVAFFDVGGSWDRVKDFSARIGSRERDLRTDVGFGLRFVTPAFPIRLDYGYGLNHRPGERLYQINFGLGPLF